MRHPEAADLDALVQFEIDIARISFPDDPEFGMFDNTFERYDSIDQLFNSEFGIE